MSPGQISVLLIAMIAMPASVLLPAQQTPQEKIIGLISMADARDVKFSGAVSVDPAGMAVGNGSVVTAAGRTAQVKLTRGGTVNVCATTSVQMTQASGSLMLSLDRGAVETRYAMSGAVTSDVVQTPDLRILISAPGPSDVRVRVNGRGDTCVENHGAGDAPFISVTPQLGDGLYRVDAGQRVMFERGNLREVVDHEPYPCGCPPNEQPKPDDFPLAVSQGLTPTPPAMTGPVAAPGEVHAQVAANLVFDSQGAAPRDSDSSPDSIPTPASPVATRAPMAATAPAPAVQRPVQPVTRAANAPPAVTQQPADAVARPVSKTGQKKNDVGHVIGRFFSRLFGKSRSAAN